MLANRKSYLAFIAVLLLVAFAIPLLLAGCSGAGGKIKLTMVESLTNPERTKVLREIADAYQAEHPNITIEIISPPLDGADQKIQQMLLNKNDMDIFEVRDTTVAQFTENDFIEPLDDYIKDWADKATLVPNVEATATKVGGKWYLIPYGFYTSMLYYRSDWLEEAGVAVPTTINELYEAAKKLTDPSKGRYGFTLRGVSGGYSLLSNLIVARLGSEGNDTNDSGYTKDGKSIYGTEYAVPKMEWIKKLYTDTCPADSISWGFQDQCQAFTTGVTAFLFQDPEVVAICQQNMDDGTWSTAPLPVDDESGQYPIGVGYAGWGIPAHSKYKTEAADFIKYLSNPDNNRKFCLQYSVIPIHNNAADKSDFFKSGPFAPYVAMNNAPEKYILMFGKARTQGGEFAKTQEVQYSQMLTGEADPAVILPQWASELDSIYDAVVN